MLTSFHPDAVLCDIRIQALAGGFGQGTAFLWSESGNLLATAALPLATDDEAFIPGLGFAIPNRASDLLKLDSLPGIA